jgi:hypothetical protein
MYYSMPINMFFIVKNHWEPYFTDSLRRNDLWKRGKVNLNCIVDHVNHRIVEGQNFVAMSVGHILN